MYRNIGLYRFKTSTTENFTSDIGIKLRRIINRPLRAVLKWATNGNVIVESYSELEKGKPYIFCSTHSFVEEIIAIFSAIDRSAYTLIGTTEQLEHNSKIYAQWLMGMIYVDRNNEFSRKDSLKKMERIINSGSSVLIFPEGVWNNSENLLCMKLFASPYYLSKATGIPIVPIAAFDEFNNSNIYIQVGN